MNLQIEAHALMPTFRKDRCATLKFTSAREVTKDEREALLEMGVNDQLGWILWSPNKMQVDDLPKEPAVESGKTSSKRLRDVIFILWKQKGEVGDFEVFYREQMEKFIDRVKMELD